MSKRKLAFVSIAPLMLFAFLFTASLSQAESGPDDGVYDVGSVLLNILHVPFKLVTCVGTQIVAGVDYVGTYGVEGNYFGGTNGREIGGVATGACKGQWIIRSEDVKRDYQ
jgi:hypothetical protein